MPEQMTDKNGLEGGRSQEGGTSLGLDVCPYNTGSHLVNAKRVLRAGPWETWTKLICSRTQ